MRILAAIAPLALLWPLLTGSNFFVHIGVSTGLVFMFAASVNLMLQLGQLSVGHAAFMGLGAYTSALLTMRLGWPFPAAFLAAVGSVTLLALLLGSLVLRIRGTYFVLLTFAFAEVVILVIKEWSGLTGGTAGLFGIPRAGALGFAVTSESQHLLLVSCMAAFYYWGLTAFYDSRLGMLAMSIAENEVLARSLGVGASAFRVAIFAGSGALAACAGSLYAHYYTYLTPDAFSFAAVFIPALTVIVIGGGAKPTGPLLAALLIVPLPELLRGAAEYQLLSYAVLLGTFVLLLPQGIVSLPARLRARWTAG